MKTHKWSIRINIFFLIGAAFGVAFATGWVQAMFSAILGGTTLSLIMSMTNFYHMAQRSLIDIVDAAYGINNAGISALYSIKNNPLREDLFGVLGTCFSYDITSKIWLFIDGLFWWQRKSIKNILTIKKDFELQARVLIDIFNVLNNANVKLTTSHMQRLYDILDELLDDYSYFYRLITIAQSFNIKMHNTVPSDQKDLQKSQIARCLLDELILELGNNKQNKNLTEKKQTVQSTKEKRSVGSKAKKQLQPNNKESFKPAATTTKTQPATAKKEKF